jgi:imidazolonepropionase-like amidohydrolase
LPDTNPLERSSQRVRNPRFDVGEEIPASPVLLKNASLIDGDGIRTDGVDIVMEKGLFSSVGVAIDASTFKGQVIDLKGHIVTPGLVDMHSHMGLDAWPYTDGSSDTNEMAETPLHPELRAIDGFDPYDLAISLINSGGITTSLVLPGSGNMM